MPRLLTRNQFIAQHPDIPRRTIEAALRRGEIPCIRLAGRAYIYADALERLRLGERGMPVVRRPRLGGGHASA